MQENIDTDRLSNSHAVEEIPGERPARARRKPVGEPVHWSGDGCAGEVSKMITHK